MLVSGIVGGGIIDGNALDGIIDDMLVTTNGMLVSGIVGSGIIDGNALDGIIDGMLVTDIVGGVTYCKWTNQWHVRWWYHSDGRYRYQSTRYLDPEYRMFMIPIVTPT